LLEATVFRLARLPSTFFICHGNKVQDRHADFSVLGDSVRGKASGAVSKKKKLDHERGRSVPPELLGRRGKEEGVMRVVDMEKE